MTQPAQNLFHKRGTLQCRGRLISTDKPLVMGILNISDDSFYDGGRYVTEQQQSTHCSRMLHEGADMIDIGACSTRPGSLAVDAKEEMLRVRNSLKWLRKEFPDILISVDTWRADVAKMAILEGGADLINDISGGTMDNRMFDTIAKSGVPYILSHIRGTPQNMQDNPDYSDLMAEVILFLSEKIDQLRQKGVNDLIIDPGFGFGKTAGQNFILARNMHRLDIFELPILAGVSRKSLIWKTLGVEPADALNGTSVINSLLLLGGANILRVHDVREAVECITLVTKYLEAESQQSQKNA